VSGMIDLEKFGEAVGVIIREVREELEKQISELQTQLDGVQKKLDRAEQRSMTFKGVFQSSLDYDAGSVVSVNDRLYFASKAIRSGGSVREGGGWTLMLKGVPQ
jgi:hypothetical protein